MTYSPMLNSAFNDTRLNNQKYVSPFSGMCSFCTEDCKGQCEIGLSAMRGADAVYPTNTGTNQVASEKDYPIDYSHFNINGRVFGAKGIDKKGMAEDQANIYNVNLERTIGKINPVKIKMPVILPALIKLNWEDYFGGAAMAGVPAVIGESAIDKDPEAVIENGKVVNFPKLNVFLDAFRKYYRGYGQIILQVNTDDDALGVPEYAIKNCGCEAIEFKFGQAAKGVQPVNRLKSLDEALDKVARGYLVIPDPTDEKVQEEYLKGRGENFRQYGRLPMWDEEYLVPRIAELRKMGLKNVYFKMAGYDDEDIEHVLTIAGQANVDMVTFDGAGGGSGYSPCKMMNEWGVPACVLQSRINIICDKLRNNGLELPDIAITGGFSMEDQVYKALALGEENISAVGLCRASMAAAMAGKKVGNMLDEGELSLDVKRFGETKDEIFPELRELRNIYGDEANDFSAGAIGVYSYLQRIAFGLKHFAALNRNFDLKYVSKRDLLPLTLAAEKLL